MTSRIKTPKDHFFQQSSKLWVPIDIINAYITYYHNLPIDEVQRALKNNLNSALESKRGAPTKANIVNKFDNIFKAVKEARLQAKKIPDENAATPSTSSTSSTISAKQWNSYGDVNINPSKKRQKIDNQISHEISKKKYTFFPPTMTPSVSANKLRIRPIEKEVLKPAYIIKVKRC